jgi:uncharacterized protein (DUF1015 family)
MVKIKSFKGIRPVKEKAALIASRPYDVLNKEEARVEAAGNPYSFLHVIKPEMDLPDDINEYSMQVYEQGKSYFQKLLNDGVLFQDEQEMIYIYAQTMNGKRQYGIVACAAVEDYMNDRIKKHELTRPDKEEDRKMHVRTSGMNYEPVFFTYPGVSELDTIVADVVQGAPEYDFTSEDGFGHHLWLVKEPAVINRIIELFAAIPATYVADGHHRTAAAALVGNERKEQNPNHTGDEEYNFFLAVHFPADQLTIIDYNRVIKDLNGLTPEQLLGKLEHAFVVENKGAEEYKPATLHNFSMYLAGNWYSLTARTGFFNDDDPIGCLDVTILSDQVLTPIFDITDLRKSKRIDFVGGIRGLGELKRRVDSGEMAAAFALYPVSMDQLIRIADTGNIMPPKTTWFEPKLRSGLVVHSLD